MNCNHELWHGFKCKEFDFQSKHAIIVFPDDSNKTNKWLLKTEYFGSFPNLELEMLRKGYHVVHVSNSTRWCKESDTDRKADFARFLIEKYGFSEKCIPVGMSCGGMQAIYFAAKYPEYVSALYLDAPVVNLLSCPGDVGIAKSNVFPEFERDMGINISELISYRNHPLDKLDVLIDNDIPIILVCGDSDKVVPFTENGKLINDLYIKRGGVIKTILKPGCDHHPHGLDDNSPIVEFIVKYS